MKVRTVDVDLFAGGGGASDGKRRATGRSPDVAVNHWPAAIAMHAANHPDCIHLIEDVRDVDPLEATGGRLVRFLWASPTCVYFSRASGARLSPETVAIRALADVIIPWLDKTHPEVAIVENVPEFLGWGPVCFDHVDGCAGAGDESGKGCSKECGYGRVIEARRGEDFARWSGEIKARGYSFEYRILKACDFGAPTTRPRLYCAMRRDGQPFAWPEPTHGPGRAHPHRTAAEIIDWSIECPSIFDRKRPHVPATRRRLAKGMRKFVFEATKPFLMHLTHGAREHDIDEPVRTVTAANRGEQSLVVPFMIHRSNGERPGQEPRVYDVQEPHPTVVAGGLKTSPVVAFLAKAYTERHEGEVQASGLDRPLGTVTAQDHHHLVAAHTACAAEWNDIIAAKARRVYRFLVEEQCDGPWMDHEQHLVRIPDTDLVVYDIGMRMLVPRELYRANGFHDSYVIDLVGPNGKPLTKTEQTRMAGNVVCPDVADALVRAALSGPAKRRAPVQLSFLEAA